jgi:hypothetical protein
VVSLLHPEQVRPAGHLFGRAGVDITPVHAAPGSDPVRELAESGEPVTVVAAAPVRSEPGLGRGNRPRPTRADAVANGPHRHRRTRRPKRRPAA